MARNSLQVFSSPERLLNKKAQWNEFVYEHCENPFLLTGFVEQFMQSNVNKGRQPLLLIDFIEERIVGIAPLAITSWRGTFKVARFLSGSDYNPDFIVQEEQREDFLYKTLCFLLKNAGCNLINIALPSSTKNLQILRKTNEKFGTRFSTVPGPYHTVLLVEKTWTEFEKDRGRNFRRFFQKIQRKMELAGTWKTIIATNENSETDIFKDILEIEESSWKQQYRTRKGIENDQSLLVLWKGALCSSPEAGFKWKVAFLEVNYKKVAYSFWLEYKDVAFICKTSFDQRYRNYYPGIYINNIAVRTIFNNPLIKQIDFMTALPFHERWTTQTRPRFRLLISKSHVPIMIANALGSRCILNIRQDIQSIRRAIPI